MQPMECKIIEPAVAIKNNNTCRICGQQKAKKEFRKIWSLRGEKIKEMKVWCKSCQKIWKHSRGFPTSEPCFIIDLV